MVSHRHSQLVLVFALRNSVSTLWYRNGERFPPARRVVGVFRADVLEGHVAGVDTRRTTRQLRS